MDQQRTQLSDLSPRARNESKVKIDNSTISFLFRFTLLLIVIYELLLIGSGNNGNYYIFQNDNIPIDELDRSKPGETNGYRCDQKVLTASARRSWKEKVYSNRHLFDACKFTPIENGGPVPTIFLVNGRSGSDATWLAITALAGGASPIGEHTGGNKVNTMKFLGTMSEEEGAWWVTEHLCEFTRRYCDKPIVGFKWKPFVDSWNLPAAKAILKKISSFERPKIRVIFMTRNPLDVLISKRKHQENKNAKAHCRPYEDDCIKTHASSAIGLTLPYDGLVKTLQESMDAFESFETTLWNMNISYIRTTYEKLYNSGDAVEWMRIFRFLGRGPSQNLTLDVVRDALPYVQTSSRSHQESLLNYLEVQSILKDTKFEELLH